VLLARHKKLNVWLPPGGHVEKDELPDDAVLREVYEETGVRAKILPNKRGLTFLDEHAKEMELPFAVILVDIERDDSHNHIDLIYVCRATTDVLVPDQNEVTDARWFACDRLYDLDIFDNVRKTIISAANKVAVCERGTGQ